MMHAAPQHYHVTPVLPTSNHASQQVLFWRELEN